VVRGSSTVSEKREEAAQGAAERVPEAIRISAGASRARHDAFGFCAVRALCGSVCLLRCVSLDFAQALRSAVDVLTRSREADRLLDRALVRSARAFITGK
jgi:hypothetical protein